MDISSNLAIWYAINKRNLPWRKNITPYRVWLSEIILQQTKVEQGLPYYYRFLEAFPTIKDLANASLDEVYKLWEGLGYYSRANNLHAAANTIVNDFDGIFPSTYEEIIKLKGVGDYTASAISSFCFNEPKPVLDGNVFRFISRLYAIDAPINKASTRSIFKSILEEAIDKKDPATFNQAIMEFGSLHCKPKQPLCNTCPFMDACIAYATNTVQEFPVKEKAKKSVNRYFNYLVCIKGNNVGIVKREEKGIWKNLNEFPLIESESMYSFENLDNLSIIKVSPAVKHILSHQNIYAKFYLVEEIPSNFDAKFIPVKEVQDLAFPRLITNFFEEYDWLN